MTQGPLRGANLAPTPPRLQQTALLVQSRSAGPLLPLVPLSPTSSSPGHAVPQQDTKPTSESPWACSASKALLGMGHPQSNSPLLQGPCHPPPRGAHPTSTC